MTKTFPGRRGAPVRAIEDLSLRVETGETLCLVGTSGCGKTTTLRLVNRLEEPTSGRVLVDGEDVAPRDPVALRRRMGYVIQSGGLFPHMTVGENVALVGELEGWEPERRRARAREVLEAARLAPDLADRYPAELSGGQRQRVGVARALFLDPPILLMDEPFGALDPITREEVQSEFEELNRRAHKTVVFVTHDLAEAFRLGDRVGLMSAGRLVQIGTLRDFEEAPATDFVRRFTERFLA